nr:MAG TPA: hypothetical protein [Bacteriophage sp.]
MPIRDVGMMHYLVKMTHYLEIYVLRIHENILKIIILL